MKTSEAISEVRKFGRFVKAFKHLEEVADNLGAADNLIKERTTELLDIDARIERANATLLGAEQEQAAQQETLAQAGTDAQAERGALLDKARAEAERILEAARAELTTLTEGNHAAALDLREIRRKITSGEAHLGGLKTKLDAAQEQARQILGA